MKRIIKVIIVTYLLFLYGTIQVFATNEIQCIDNKNGIVTIKYNNVDNVKTKVAVYKGTTKYYYNLSNGFNDVPIPLTEGNGNYKVMICKNITGTKFSILKTYNIELDLADETKPFLQSSQIVKWSSTDEAIKKAKSITKNCRTVQEKIKVVYKYIIENYTYDYNKVSSLSKNNGYIPNIESIYKNKKGICYDMAAINAAMLRSLGIKTKLIMGFTPKVNTYHAWNLVYNPSTKKWITIDTTYDLGKSNAVMVKPYNDYKDIHYCY